MSQHDDFHTASQTHSGEDSLTGDSTLTGEQGDRPLDPQVKAKNKISVKMAGILTAVVVVVGGFGYMAFFKHGGHAPSNAGFHAPLSAQVTHPSPASLPVSPATVENHPAPPKLATPGDAQALLGGPSPATSPGALPAAQPSAPGTILGTAPAGTIAAPVVSAPLATPVAAPPASSASALPGATPSVIATPATTPVEASPAVTGALEDRVSHLEDRVTALEKGQSHILEILATQPAKAIKASQSSEASKGKETPVNKAKPKVHHQPINRVEVITPKVKPTVAEKTTSPSRSSSAGCQIASIVPNRAWTKQSDGTFLTYGVGDTAPNGSVIKSIDPDTGVITEKGKLHCPLAD